ncbi:hypothetical protein M0805_003109 [Coniferiporia weirii]|nr:hypothetical protein M0805_003109 [Coniferiporia weirii]
MLPSPDLLSALLKALGLTQSVFKPIPDLVDGVIDSVDGITHGLGLPGISDLPLIGSLLDVGDPQVDPYGSIAPEDVEVLDATSCNVDPYDPPQVLSQTFPTFDQVKANVFRYRQQQSVNLGSWFVHEQWMTPTPFDCASGPQSAEIDIASGWGNTTAAQVVLERHWDTFINQSDFEYLASIGINTVRLPIGYWSLGPVYCQGTPFEQYADVYTNSWSRVVRAINWADEAGIGVLVDLHGAVGSQNGQPHSGISDGQANLFNNATNMNLTINVLTFLVQQLASVTNVVGIEILNEPNDDPSLPDFYTRAINSMRQVSTMALGLPLYIHDAFNLDEFSGFVASRSDFIVEDHHSYFVFDNEDVSRDADQDTGEVQGTMNDQLSSASGKQRRNLVIGEWSGALVSSSLANETNPLLARQQFCQGQAQVYANTTAGWHFWSYMKEGCDTDPDWCFKNAVGNTLPPLFFSYGCELQTTSSKLVYPAGAVTGMELPPMMQVFGLENNEPSWTSTESASSDGVPDPSLADLSSNIATGTLTASDVSSTPTQGTSKRDLGIYYQRFSAIHSHRGPFLNAKKYKRDNVTSASVSGMTPAERSITKGYSDGFLTAKIFAQYDMSKLGFTGQYISDSINTLGSGVIASGTEDYYSEWFLQGLEDAQGSISAQCSGS